jgi:hypothetical protein
VGIAQDLPEFAESMRSTANSQGLCKLYRVGQLRLQAESQEADRSGVFNWLGTPVEIRYGCLSTVQRTSPDTWTKNSPPYKVATALPKCGGTPQSAASCYPYNKTNFLQQNDASVILPSLMFPFLIDQDEK